MSWQVRALVPPGLLERLSVCGLQRREPIVHDVTNHVVFTHEGAHVLLDRAGVGPSSPPLAAPVGERRRLSGLSGVLARGLPGRLPDPGAFLTFDEARPAVEAANDSPYRTTPLAAPRVDLTGPLRRGVRRVLRDDDPTQLAALFALLDLLLRFDGACQGELDLAAPSEPAGFEGARFGVRVGLGDAGIALLGGRVDAAVAERAAAALQGADEGSAGLARGLRAGAVIDKCERLSGCSGFKRRVCLGALELTAREVSYRDEVLWADFEEGDAYS